MDAFCFEVLEADADVATAALVAGIVPSLMRLRIVCDGSDMSCAASSMLR